MSLPKLAKKLQLGYAFVKNESSRFGLPSFKILGVLPAPSFAHLPTSWVSMLPTISEWTLVPPPCGQIW